MTIISRQGDWLTAKVGDQMVMMSATNGNYLGLNEVGVRVWELLETPRELDALCTLLETEYDVSPETCRAEVEAFVTELIQNGAASLDPR